jgi:hypothetical protein
MAPEEHASRIEDSEPEQIGIRMGLQPGGHRLICIDVDLPGGDEQLRELEARLGELPRTLEQRTGGGGQHLVFEWPSDLGEAPRHKLAGKIDLRGERQHIVAAPSPHASGRRYEVVDDVQPAHLPRAWAEHIEGMRAPAIALVPSALPAHVDDHSALGRCLDYVSRIDGAISGQGGGAHLLGVLRVLGRDTTLARLKSFAA